MLLHIRNGRKEVVRLNVYTIGVNSIVLVKLRRAYLRDLGLGEDGVFVGLDLAHLDAVLHDLGLFEDLPAGFSLIRFLVKESK